jgi:ketosteroid isomerase-like protein
MSEQNKQTVLAYVDAFNRGDLEGVCRQFTPDALAWGVLGWGEIEKVREVWRDLIESLEIRLQVESIVAEGNVVAVRFTERGRSVREFRGMRATGRSYEAIAMEWFEMQDGRIHRRWGARDSGTIYGQLGFPPPGTESRSGLEALAVRFEVDHPDLADALRRFVDALGKAGI